MGSAKSFGKFFWVLQVSSPAVLLRKTAETADKLDIIIIAGAKRYFRPRGFSIAAASAPAPRGSDGSTVHFVSEKCPQAQAVNQTQNGFLYPFHRLPSEGAIP